MWTSQTQVAELSQELNRRQPATLANQNPIEDNPRDGFIAILSVAALADDSPHDSAHVHEIHHQHDEDAGVDDESKDIGDKMPAGQPRVVLFESSLRLMPRLVESFFLDQQIADALVHSSRVVTDGVQLDVEIVDLTGIVIRNVLVQFQEFTVAPSRGRFDLGLAFFFH